jgi:hypothetical protein
MGGVPHQGPNGAVSVDGGASIWAATASGSRHANSRRASCSCCYRNPSFLGIGDMSRVPTSGTPMGPTGIYITV